MDLFLGMRIATFGSFVLGVSTFILCGWTYLANIKINDSFKPNGCDIDDLNENSTIDFSTIENAFITFKSMIFHATMVVLVVTIIQIISAAVILGSAIQGCRERSKIWFALNLGVNLILLICPLMTVMYGQELRSKFPTCFIEIRNQIENLDSYYVGVSIDFIVQFHALVACLLMLRFDRGREYHLVELI